MTTHETYMQIALEAAREAARLGEIPVGACIVREGGDPRRGVQYPGDSARSAGPCRDQCHSAGLPAAGELAVGWPVCCMSPW